MHRTFLAKLTLTLFLMGIVPLASVFPAIEALADSDPALEATWKYRDHGADVTLRDWWHRPPLVDAANAGNLRLVKMLLDQGADIHAKNGNGETAIDMAVRHGRLEIAKLLLQRGAKQNLASSAFVGDIDAVRCLLNEDGGVASGGAVRDLPVSREVSGVCMPLMRLAVRLAGEQGHVQILKLLLDHVKIAQQNQELTDIAFDAASRNGRSEVVRMILKRGFDINARYRQGQTPLVKTVQSGNEAMIKLLLARGADIDVVDANGNSALMTAASRGRRNVVEMLLDAGADPGPTNWRGESALVLAAARGHVDVVKLLCERTAGSTGRPSADRAALYAAVRHQQPDVVKLFWVPGTTLDLDMAVALGDLTQIREHLDRYEDIDRAERELRSESLLLIAARHGRTNVVKLLLERGGDPNVTRERRPPSSHDGPLTPLKEAARSGHLETVKTLVAAGARVNPYGSDENSALLEAAENGHTKVVEFLLTKGAEVSAGTRFKGTPLLAAADMKHLKVMRVLVEHGADVNDAQSLHYFGARLEVASPVVIPIEVAAEAGDVDLVRLMLDKGARITGKNNLGTLALMVAVRNGHTDMVDLLHERGVRLTLSQLAHLHQFKELFRRIETLTDVNETSGDEPPPLVTVAKAGDLQLVEYLLKRGADINGQGNTRGTALMNVAGLKDLAIAKLLLDRGADVNAKTAGGDTALMCAAGKGNVDLVKLLFDKGATVKGTGTYGTVLDYAVHAGEPDAIKLIIEKGADVNEVPEWGYTPLMRAAERGHVKAVKLLLEKGARVNAITRYGNTALLEATEQGHEDVVKVLVEHGVDVNQTDTHGRTALMVAAERGDEYVLRLLLDNGADANLADKSGNTAKDYAQRRGFSHLAGVIRTSSEQVDPGED